MDSGKRQNLYALKDSLEYLLLAYDSASIYSKSSNLCEKIIEAVKEAKNTISSLKID